MHPALRPGHERPPLVDRLSQEAGDEIWRKERCVGRHAGDIVDVGPVLGVPLEARKQTRKRSGIFAEAVGDDPEPE